MANEFIARNGVIALANSSISGSLTVSGGITGSFSGSIIGSASYATISDSSSYALSSSFSATASYALNAGAGGISSISIADEGTFQGPASYFNFIGAGVTTAVSANTASFTITGGSGGGTTVLGGTAVLTQSFAATTWSFAHNLGLVYPVVTIYDGTSVIQPQNITPTDANNLKIYFSSPKSGYAVAVAGGGYYVTNAGTTRVLTVTTASSTWTFQHNIGDQYPAFEIYDASNNVLIPSNIQAVDINTATITFAYPATGKAVATLGGGSGYGTVITTTSASSTWSLTHNLRENYPIVTIWESGSNQIVQPDTITSVDQNTVLVTFTTPVKGYANISRAGSVISGSTDWNLLINKPNMGAVYSQSLAASTWNINHNLDTQYPLVTIYDSSNAVVLPQSIVGTDANNITITFPSAQTGYANLSKAGSYISGSVLYQNITNAPFQSTGSVVSMSGSLIITGSLTVSGSGTFNNVGPSNFTGSVNVTGSLNTIGTITATTLVVQTITSSISSITGSTKFGQLSSNTHQFTGSMFVTGAFYVATGSVGIGTASPTKALEIISNTSQDGIKISGTSNPRLTIIDTTNNVQFDALTTDTEAVLRTDTNHPLHFSTNGTLRMFISSSGNVGIGTTTPSYKLFVAGEAYSTGWNVANTGGSIQTIDAGAYISLLGGTNATPNTLLFGTNNAEKMRVTSAGYTKMSSNGTYAADILYYHEMRQTGPDWNLILQNTSATSATRGVYLEYTAYTPNNTSNYAYYFTDSTAVRFYVASNGGIYNYQSNNSNLSDIRTKKDIAPLESYWNKFKAIEIVKFKYKDQTHDDFNIGVIAQQVEAVAPEFVDVDSWDIEYRLEKENTEKNSTEEPMKSIYTADLYHATIKVLQEAMAKIETLEARVQYLENK